MHLPRSTALLGLALLAACGSPPTTPHEPLGKLPSAVTTAEPEWIPPRVLAGQQVERDSREQHFGELRQLTIEGSVLGSPAWSADGSKLLFAVAADVTGCSRIQMLDLRTGELRSLPPNRGWALGAVFRSKPAGGVLIAFADDPRGGCPALRQASRPGRFAVPTSDVYALDPASGDLEPLLTSPEHEGSLATSADGRFLAWTSTRGGDAELYVSRTDGSEVVRVTDSPGYDGGASFSPDGMLLAWHSERAATPAAPNAYGDELAAGVVEPRRLAIVVGGTRGQHASVVVDDGHLNMSPVFFPDSRRLLFVSSRDAGGASDDPNFELVAADPNAPPTTAGHPPLDRITYYAGYDGAPAFSPDGRFLAFASSRHADRRGQINLFVARWVD